MNHQQPDPELTIRPTDQSRSENKANTFWGGLRGKTIWDWLTLMVVPLVIALGGFILSEAQRSSSMQIELDRQREAALRQYFDVISDLLLNQDLRLSERGSEIQAVARVRTLEVLRALDGERKAAVLRFLYEAQLIVHHHDWQGEPGIIQLKWADLSGAVLPGAQLMDASLEFVDLSGSDLRGASLENANLYGAKLIEADLSDATLSGANLKHAQLERSNLRRATLTRIHLGTSLLPLPFDGEVFGVEIEPVQFSYTTLIGADLRDANLKEVDFFYSDLTQARLSGADLTEAKFFETDLSTADLSGAILTRASFEGAILNDNTRLDRKWRQLWELVNGVRSFDMQRLDLTGANLGYLDLSGKDLSGLNLSEAEFHNCRFVQANLQETNLTGAVIFRPDFSGANLKGTRFKDAYMIEAIMDSADLDGADLTNAMLGYANLSGAQNLTDEQLSSAKNLLFARMPDGSLYDGRFRLANDLELAGSKGITPEDPQAMAEFYQVSLEAYQAGQDWAEESR